jgi:hypothetical protein
MRPSLTAEMAQVVIEDRIQAAEHYRRQEEARHSVPEPDRYEAVTVRLARDEDLAEVRRLVQLEGGHELAGPVLLAEAEGELVAARSLANGAAVADPFRHTAHLAELLALRSVHLRDDGAGPKRPGLTGRLALALRVGHS